MDYLVFICDMNVCKILVKFRISVFYRTVYEICNPRKLGMNISNITKFQILSLDRALNSNSLNGYSNVHAYI